MKRHPKKPNRLYWWNCAYLCRQPNGKPVDRHCPLCGHPLTYPLNPPRTAEKRAEKLSNARTAAWVDKWIKAGKPQPGSDAFRNL